MTHDRRHDEHADDAVVEAAWRKASSDEPSAHVDAAILAAARAEVRREAPARHASARPPWWSRWQPLAAAAGVAGLAFVLVQMLPRDDAVRAPVTTERAPQGSEDFAPREMAGSVKQDNVATGSAAAPATAPPPAISPARPASPAASAAESRIEVPAPAAELGASAPPAAPAAAQKAAAATAHRSEESVAARLSPDAWARRIAGLHESGDLAAAVDELRAFRQAYPDADEHLPPALRPWAASVTARDLP